MQILVLISLALPQLTLVMPPSQFTFFPWLLGHDTLIVSSYSAHWLLLLSLLVQISYSLSPNVIIPQDSVLSPFQSLHISPYLPTTSTCISLTHSGFSFKYHTCISTCLLSIPTWKFSHFHNCTPNLTPLSVVCGLPISHLITLPIFPFAQKINLRVILNSSLPLYLTFSFQNVSRFWRFISLSATPLI